MPRSREIWRVSPSQSSHWIVRSSLLLAAPNVRAIARRRSVQQPKPARTGRKAHPNSPTRPSARSREGRPRTTQTRPFPQPERGLASLLLGARTCGGPVVIPRCHQHRLPRQTTRLSPGPESLLIRRGARSVLQRERPARIACRQGPTHRRSGPFRCLQIRPLKNSWHPQHDGLAGTGRQLGSPLPRIPPPRQFQ